MKGLIDDALEVTVIGSFSGLGIRARRRLFRWRDPEPDALRGRTVVVTGPTSGLGRRATDELAEVGARIVLVGRSAERLADVRTALVKRHGEDRFPTVVADMSSLTSVRAAADAIVRSEARIDVVVDNAGAIFQDRAVTADGIEATLAVLVVGPFALVAGLLPVLRATAGSRVIAVSSGGMYTEGLALDDLGWEARPFSGPRAYARAKRAQVMLTREWARRLRGSGIAFVSMHPGWADTPGLSASLPGFAGLMRPILRTPSEGVDTLVWLALLPDAGGLAGRFVHDRKARPFDRVPMTRVDQRERRRLWRAIVELAGVEDPAPSP
ncbi:MAG TPA: SDR family NAD(P)-dependent oxidoreductase [Candidatus Limnocylindria bacterium]